MPFCHICGTKLNNERICGVCGTPVMGMQFKNSKKVSGYPCPSCGNGLAKDELSCGNCGYVFPDNRGIITRTFECARCGSIRLKTSYEERFETVDVRRTLGGTIKFHYGKAYYWIVIGWWYWPLIGWWLHPLWLFFSLDFGTEKVKKKIKYTTTVYTCKKCGYEWTGRTRKTKDV